MFASTLMAKKVMNFILVVAFIVEGASQDKHKHSLFIVQDGANILQHDFSFLSPDLL